MDSISYQVSAFIGQVLSVTEYLLILVCVPLCSK